MATTTTTTTEAPTTFQTDFSEYTAGNPPGDWTGQWVTSNVTWTVKNNIASPDYGGQVLEADCTSSDQRSALSWDDVGSVNDAEILAHVKAENANYFSSYLILRGGGSAGSESCIRCHINSGEIQLTGYGQSFTAQKVRSASDNTWYWVRFRVQGTAVKVKAWSGDILEEPADWDVEVTETNLTSGWVGVAHFESSYEGWWDWFSVGTGGESAPDPETSRPGDLLVSKATGYAVLSTLDAVNVSKQVAYAVLSTEVTVGVSKAVGYAVLEEYEPSSEADSPIVFIVT